MTGESNQDNLSPEDSASAKSHNVQHRLLAKWKSSHTVVEATDTGGGRVVGIIKAFDQYVLHLEYTNRGNPQSGESGYTEDIMLFKHAIRSIRPYRKNFKQRNSSGLKNR